MRVERSDAELVAAIRGGDPSAWGDVFDRYRDSVWHVAWSVARDVDDAEDVVSATFLRGVESIDQLREPERLRPWLLSIARRRALDRVRPSREREVATDPATAFADGFDAGSDPDQSIAGLRREETVQLVEDAFEGLDPRDRAALELAERQEMSGEELAETLGVSRDNAYAMVHNARTRFELSVASLVVARVGRDDCSELDEILDGWDGTLSPIIRKRVARHVKACDTCESTKRVKVSPAALLALLPVVGISTLAADQSKAAALEAATSPPSPALPMSTAPAVGAGKIAALVAGAVLAVGIGAAVIVGLSSGDSEAPRAAPALDRAVLDTTPAVEEPGDTATEVELPSTTEAVEPCVAVASLTQFASAGPASADVVDVQIYLTTTNSLIQQVLGAYGDDASDDLEAYAAAYQGIINDEIWNLSELPNSDELAALSVAVETELSADCS